MPGKHNAGGCGCCDGCPSAGVNIIGSDATIGISGTPDSATVEEWNPSTGAKTNTYTLSPPTGSHVVPYVAGRVYIITLVGPGSCLFQSTYGAATCTCAGIIKRFARVTIVHDKGTLTGTDFTGIYIAPLQNVSIFGCVWEVGRTVVSGVDAFLLRPDYASFDPTKIRLDWIAGVPLAQTLSGLQSCVSDSFYFDFPFYSANWDVTLELI